MSGAIRLKTVSAPRTKLFSVLYNVSSNNSSLPQIQTLAIQLNIMVWGACHGKQKSRICVAFTAEMIYNIGEVILNG